MKIRAQIIIDLDAGDYIAAADHQRRIEAVFRDIRSEYENASLTMGQVRPHTVMRADDRRRRKRRSGNLAVYHED